MAGIDESGAYGGLPWEEILRKAPRPAWDEHQMYDGSMTQPNTLADLFGLTLGQPHWKGGKGLPKTGPKMSPGLQQELEKLERLRQLFPDLSEDALQFLLANGMFAEPGPQSRPIQR